MKQAQWVRGRRWPELSLGMWRAAGFCGKQTLPCGMTFWNDWGWRGPLDVRIPSYWFWVGYLHTVFALFVIVQRLPSGRKLGEGLLCRFACFCLIICLQDRFVYPACEWSCGPSSAVELCLFAPRDRSKSRCCKSAEAAIFRHFKTCLLLVI